MLSGRNGFLLLHAWLLLFLLFSAVDLPAGWIEKRPDKTIIHIQFDLPDAHRTDTPTRADVAAVKAFVTNFPAMFREKYQARYQAEPGRYGDANWENVELQLHRHTGIQVEGVESTLLSIAGKNAPDILYVNFRQSDTYIQQGFLHPLDREEDGYLAAMSEEQKDFRIHPKIWPVIHRKGPGGKEQTWAIPRGGALGKVLLYRKDLFDQAGVPYPDDQWTWDDLLDACRRISDPARGIYGMRFSRGKHEAYHWMTFLWSAGGEAVVYNEGLDRWEAVFNSREAAVALDFYTQLNTEPWKDENGRQRYGYVYKDPTNARYKWSRGEIATWFWYIDEKLFSTINPEITGMAPVPFGPGGERGAELNSRMMGLFAGIEELAVRDAAWEFIRYYDSKESWAIRTRIMVEGGFGRFINPRYLEMFGYDEIIRLAPKGWAETFEKAIASGHPEPYGKNCNYAYDIMTIPLHEAESAALDGDLPADREERLDVLQGMLAEASLEANEKMLGIYSPEQLRKQRVSAAAVLTLLVVGFAWVVRKISRVFKGPEEAGGSAKGWQFRKYLPAYLILLPAVLTIFVWHYVPLLWGSVMAFQDYMVMGGSTWVWLDNFGEVLWDGTWWNAVFNSFRYSFLVIALTFFPPVILAILLQEIPRGKVLFRIIYYLPGMITGLVVILLWKSFYEPSERGVLNAVLMQIPALGYILLGLFLLAVGWAFARRLMTHDRPGVGFLFLCGGALLCFTCVKVAWPIMLAGEGNWFARLFQTMDEPYRWLLDDDTAMLSCVIPLLWAGIGPGCLIYLAALKGIPDDLYEAADMDGATLVDKVLFIILPIFRPLLIINFVGVFIGSWNASANILAMTGGASNTEVAGLHIFYKAFIFLKFGPATAMAWLLGFMLIGFTVHQLRILSRLEFKTTGEDN